MFFSVRIMRYYEEVVSNKIEYNNFFEEVRALAMAPCTNYPLFYRGAGRPDANAPISARPRRGSSFPLYSGKYAAPVYGHNSTGEPL